jgi:hypothetical protein
MHILPGFCRRVHVTIRELPANRLAIASADVFLSQQIPEFMQTVKCVHHRRLALLLAFQYGILTCSQ